MEPQLNIELKYIDAKPTDSKLLTDTALLSKKYWGYDDKLINLWRSDLEISAEYISKNKVVKVYIEDKFIGFFGIKFTNEKEAEIDHLWLIPEKINKGFGRSIFNHIFKCLKSKNYKKTTLVAEPNAKGFYDKMGGRVIGQRQSKVSGRFLDIYEFKIET